jgi:hypothetical protein
MVANKEETAQDNLPGIYAKMNRLTSVQANSWYKPEKGNCISGQLMGRFLRSDDDGHYYQIRVDNEVEVMAPVKGGDGFDLQKVPKGSVVNVDERKALKCLQDHVDEANYFVMIKCKDKKKIRGGKTFWEFDVHGGVVADKDLPFDDVPF